MESVKIVDGVTYRLVRRTGELSYGEPLYFWQGDNGNILDLTDEEKERVARD